MQVFLASSEILFENVYIIFFIAFRNNLCYVWFHAGFYFLASQIAMLLDGDILKGKKCSGAASLQFTYFPYRHLISSYTNPIIQITWKRKIDKSKIKREKCMHSLSWPTKINSKKIPSLVKYVYYMQQHPE